MNAGRNADSPRRRIAILVNPGAGNGRAQRLTAPVLRRLREHGVAIDQVLADTPAAAQERLLAAAGRDPEAILTVGGDGTHAIGVQVAVRTGVPLAVVPAGTGNDLPRALGLAAGDWSTAVDRALHAPVRAMDAGLITRADGSTRSFATVATAGFDSLVTDRANALRRPRGRSRYLVAVAAEYARLSARPFRLRLDESEVVDGPLILCAVGNTASYGGGMRICPEADPFDGLLDLTVVHDVPRPRLELPRVVGQIYRGSHLEHPAIRPLRGRTVELESPGMNVYGDGDLAGRAPVRLEACPAALPVVLPDPTS